MDAIKSDLELLPLRGPSRCASRGPDGDMAVPLLLQAVALFRQEDVGRPRQRPEAHDSRHAHQLILVRAQFFLAIARERLNIPKRRDMQEQRGWISVQITGSPVPCLRERSLQRLARDRYLAAVELAHASGYDMHIQLLVALGPLELAIVARAQVPRIVRELLLRPA